MLRLPVKFCPIHVCWEIPRCPDNCDQGTPNHSSFEWIELVPREIVHSLCFFDAHLSDRLRTLHLRLYTSFLGANGENSDGLEERLHTLTGFDNTGNVSLWPSELLLAHAMFVPCFYPGLWELLGENRRSFKRVCELGAGMTGAAGLSVSLCPLLNPDYVLLTDGNRRCVDSLYATLAHHLTRIAQERCGVRMEVLQLTWPHQMSSLVELPVIHLSRSFQLIIASDCLFDTTGHSGLLELIDQLLCNDLSATFLAVAPLRGQTLTKFVSLVQLCDKWSLVRLEPNEYMSHELVAYMYEGVSEMESKFIRDKFVGQLIVMRRMLKV
ncbi:hypothetical protein EG68_04136 [Paragonimus skrjabini miyazakii]|uniref:Calmodulin-lysine N-methyltransferase n=1 Tax=Paragonimus skrjabini miyazakii TaxID=59628 RepID=A0A8S9YY68_9TREM|nr:hypothetical protein EG68_04136 [Paragonimus skrjabini miyazakii]